jgi:hypothetical protein
MSDNTDALSKIAKIRALNDEFRRTFLGGRVMLTPGIMGLDKATFACTRLISQIRVFTDFDESNDPWHEHDFGALEIDSQKVFWKIDYYDAECCYGSPNPADPNLTTRVLTIMLASEY